MDGSEGGGEPTVDGDVGAGDVPRGIAGEESDEAGDLVGLREASGDAGGGRACGDVRGVGATSGGDGVGDPALAQPQIRGDRTWADGVDPDAEGPDLLGKGLAEVGEGSLGGAVVDHNRVGQERVYRAGGDDRAAASR